MYICHVSWEKLSDQIVLGILLIFRLDNAESRKPKNLRKKILESFVAAAR